MKKILFAILMAASTFAMADFNTGWDPVTTRTDGTAAVPSYYQISCGSSTGSYNRNYNVTPGTAVSFTVPENSGVFCAIRAFDNTDSPSGYSNEIYFAAPLNAPANFRILIN